MSMGNFEYSKSVVFQEIIIGTKVIVENSIELLNEKIARLYKYYAGIEYAHLNITIEPYSDLYMLEGKYCMIFLIKKIVEK